MRRTLLAVVLGGSACVPDGPGPAGTSVGNPGQTSLVLARTGDGLSVESAVLQGTTVILEGCDGATAVVIDAADTVGLLDAEAWPVPAGTWCSLAVSFDRLEADGTSDENTGFEVTLQPEREIVLQAGAPIVVDETAYVLELAVPGWLGAGDLPPPGDGGTSVVGAESALAATLVDALVTGSTWTADDGDGVLDEAERAEGPVASAAFPAPDPAAGDTGTGGRVALEGCGNCHTAPGAPSAIWGLLVCVLPWLGARRRSV